MSMYRVGFGTDIHRLVSGRPLIIGGVAVDTDVGAEGHSDADVLLHAVTDAVLGSLALGDIGQHFSDDEVRWQDADSTQFLRYAAGLIAAKGFSVANVDSVVDLETPKLRPHIERMRENIAAALGVDISRVSIKAKTGERVDAVGERRAVRAQAVVLVEKTEIFSDK